MRKYAQKYYDFKLKEPDKNFTELFNEKVKALDNPLFKKDQLGKIAFLNHLRDSPLIIIIVHISQKDNNYYLDIPSILSYLLNGFKEGSLKNYLLKQNYITDLEVGSLVYSKKNDLIYFYLDLTKNGSDNIDKVIEALYSALNNIKEDKNIEILLNNFKAITQITFKLLEEKKTVIPDDIDNLLKNYDLYGKEEILGNLINEHYSKDKIDEFLNKFSPENSFIFVDSPYEIKSENLTSSEIAYIKSYKSPYKINKIPEDFLNKLKTIKAIDEYEFKPRDTNEDYLKNEDLTEEPCYKTKSKKCEYNEYNPDKPELIEPYTLVNSSNILSLVKIDRSFGIPFVKGYIDLELDNDRFKSIINNEKNSVFIIYCNLL
jgi:secreted Zn-dependent insulinase-like peptidase